MRIGPAVVVTCLLTASALGGCRAPDCGPYHYDRARHVCTCHDGSMVDGDSGVCVPRPDDAATDAGCEERSWFRDSDRDGYGDSAMSVHACIAPDGYVELGEDCDDSCAECRPDGSERCNTAADEDCDGNPVTDCGCTAGTAQHCLFCGDECDWACGPLGCSDAIHVAAGRNHTCVVREDRTVACWGKNAEGQLGTGDLAPSETPRTVPGLTGVASIVAGGSHACALGEDRTVRCWGSNSHGQIGNGESGPGLVVATPVLVTGTDRVVALSAGANHTCAVLADGAVACWGANEEGQAGAATVGAGAHLATPTLVPGVTGATAIASGWLHTCAIARRASADGAVLCWGDNSHGQLGNASTESSSEPVRTYFITGATLLAAGRDHTCAVDGAVLCWGANERGQIGNGRSATVHIEDVPISVSDISHPTALAAGEQFSCAALPTGVVKCWGDAAAGRLGDGRTSGWSDTPVEVAGLDVDAVGIVCGARHTLVLGSGGALRAWGSNYWGELGDGTTTVRPTPVAPLSP